MQSNYREIHQPLPGNRLATIGNPLAIIGKLPTRYLPKFGIWYYQKFMTHKWYHFWPFFCQLHENISQKRGSDSHFEMLSVSKP